MHSWLILSRPRCAALQASTFGLGLSAALLGTSPKVVGHEILWGTSGLTTIAAGKGEQMAKPDADSDQVTFHRLDEMMFLLVGTIILTSVNLGFWTFFMAVTRYFGWLGGFPRGYITRVGTPGLAGTPPIIRVPRIVPPVRRKL